MYKCDIGINESPGMDLHLPTPVRRVQLTNRDATEPGQPVQRQRDVQHRAQHRMQRSTTCHTASYATQHSRDTASNAVQHHVRHDIECYPDEQLSGRQNEAPSRIAMPQERVRHPGRGRDQWPNQLGTEIRNPCDRQIACLVVAYEINQRLMRLAN